MNTRITAEFDSVDMAELAGRRIRDSLSGITRIDIHQKQGDTQNYYYYSGALPYIQPFNSTSANLFYPTFPENLQYEQIEAGQEATIDINCDKESCGQVISCLNNYGALKIRRRS